MTAVLGQWRATYAPGEWVVLSGPTSLVLMQPFADEWAEMVATLWEEVLASSSLIELATQLAAHGIDDMPHFGAFFWDADGMRSLVRGDVTVVDLETGDTVADGQGFLTWSEVGLGQVGKIRIETPVSEEIEGMELPLVVGAVRASSVVLDTDPSVRAQSPQGESAEWLDEGPSTEAEPILESTEAEPAVDNGLWVDPDVVDEVDLMENGDTELMQLPFPPAPEPLAVARIIVSDGNTFDLDRPVLIGRAPSDGTGDGVERLLVTVLSPNQDISRTHVQLAPQDGQVMVTDLHSTNGTILVRPGADMQRVRLTADAPISVPVESLLELGDGISVLIEPSSHPQAR
ncbi:MAG: FHA domain-containing protein [Propionibacteriaceae bacterium]